MADATVTLKLKPSELKHIQIALELQAQAIQTNMQGTAGRAQTECRKNLAATNELLAGLQR